MWLKNCLVLVALVLYSPTLVFSGTPNPFIAVIETSAAAESFDFKNDPVLVQKVDRVNEISSYYRPDGMTNGVPVFHRNAVDSNKPVVVLDDGQDHLSHSSNKRTFVVLRQKEKESKEYYVVYVYVR